MRGRHGSAKLGSMWDSRFTREADEVYVGNYCTILGPLKASRRVRIDPYCLITTGVVAAENVQVCAGVVMVGGKERTVRFEGWNFVAYGSRLICGSEDFTGRYGPVNAWWGKNKVNEGDIVFKRYSGVCTGVTVMPGVTLCDGAVVAAGSFVPQGAILMPWWIYKGRPATPWKERTRFSEPEPEWLRKHA